MIGMEPSISDNQTAERQVLSVHQKENEMEKCDLCYEAEGIEHGCRGKDEGTCVDGTNCPDYLMWVGVCQCLTCKENE